MKIQSGQHFSKTNNALCIFYTHDFIDKMDLVTNGHRSVTLEKTIKKNCRPKPNLPPHYGRKLIPLAKLESTNDVVSDHEFHANRDTEYNN